MKTIVVAFDDLNAINNFNALEQLSPNDDYRIISHSSPEFFVNYNGFFRNYDIRVTSIRNTNLIDDSDIGRIVYMPRYPKTHMHAMINSYCNSKHFKHHHPIRSWSHDLAMLKDSSITGITSDIIIKLTNGARGIGQFLIKHNESSTPRHALELFRELISKGYADLNSSEAYGVVEVSETKLSTVLSVVEKAMMETFPPNTISFSGLDERDITYFTSALSDIKDWHVELFVTGIKSEYRVIKSKNKNIICKRQFKTDTPFQQATGKESIGYILDSIPELNEAATAELNDLIDCVVPDNNSVDVFIKPYTDVETGITSYRFGIFEFSNQFGFMGIPIELILEAQRKFIISHYHKLVHND